MFRHLCTIRFVTTHIPKSTRHPIHPNDHNRLLSSRRSNCPKGMNVSKDRPVALNAALAYRVLKRTIDVRLGSPSVRNIPVASAGGEAVRRRSPSGGAALHHLARTGSGGGWRGHIRRRAAEA